MQTTKYLFLATNDNKMQIMHLLLNALHFNEAGHRAVLVFECSSPKLLRQLENATMKMPLFDKALNEGIIDHACKSCTAAFSATEAAENLGVPLKGPLKGHSDLLAFVEDDYSILSF
jgi:hypothetical protein